MGARRWGCALLCKKERRRCGTRVALERTAEQGRVWCLEAGRACQMRWAQVEEDYSPGMCMSVDDVHLTLATMSLRSWLPFSLRVLILRLIRAWA